MRIVFSHEREVLNALDTENGDYTIPANCIVRNELNGRRKLHDPSEVVYAMTENRYERDPYMPRTFPMGIYWIQPPVARPDNKYLAPYFIPTNATREVHIWHLDKKGGYAHETNKTVVDHGYGIHYSTSSTTLGCIRIYNELDLIKLVRDIQYEHKFEKHIKLYVVE